MMYFIAVVLFVCTEYIPGTLDIYRTICVLACQFHEDCFIMCLVVVILILYFI